MVNPIQAAPVEVENSTKESAGSPNCGFSDVLAEAGSTKGEGESVAKARAAAEGGKKTHGNPSEGSGEKEQEPGASSRAVQAPIAMPVQIVPLENAVPHAVRAIATAAPVATAYVAEAGCAFDAAAVFGNGQQAEVASEQRPEATRPETENSAAGGNEEVNGNGFVKSLLKETDAARAEASKIEVKASAGQPSKLGESVPMESPKVDATLTKPMRTEAGEETTRGDFGGTKLQNDSALTAERSAKTQESQLAVGTANATTSEAGPQSVPEKVRAENRQPPAGQTVQIAGEARAKVDDSQDGGLVPPPVNHEPASASHLETRQTDHSRTTKPNSALESSAGFHKNANFDGPVANAVAIERSNSQGSKAAHQAFESSGSGTPRAAETWTRLPESFVPGGSQLLLRLSHQEMRFGWNTPEFGRVEVRAIVEHDRVGAVISADARLCDSLQADLGSLNRALANQSLELTHFQASSSGSEESATRGQDTGAQSEIVASGDDANWRSREIGEQVLSIHQGALDLRA